MPYGFNLPDILIIGVQKAATNSLFYYLGQHPEIKSSITKEIHFFDRDVNYEKGLYWYKWHFPLNFNNYKLIEATPCYLYYDKSPARIKKLGKELKLIISLRDPVRRAFSAWNMYYMQSKNKAYLNAVKKKWGEIDNWRMLEMLDQKEFPSFEEVIEREMGWIINGKDVIQPGLIRRGFYKEQIQRWLEYFPKNWFYFMNTEELNNYTISTFLCNIFEFVEVEPNLDFDAMDLEKKWESKYVRTFEDVDNGIIDYLYSLYNEKNDGLSEITGIDHQWLN